MLLITRSGSSSTENTNSNIPRCIASSAVNMYGECENDDGIGVIFCEVIGLKQNVIEHKIG